MSNKSSRARLTGVLFVALTTVLALTSVVVFAQGNGGAGGNGAASKGGNAASQSSGVYTKAQAAIGKGIYSAYCQVCHAYNLKGKVGPSLTGKYFAKTWEDGNHTADGLFYIISNLMPQSNPGSLSKNQYVDVMAYILQQNGYPAGKTRLPSTDSALKKIPLKAPSKTQTAQKAQ